MAGILARRIAIAAASSSKNAGLFLRQIRLDTFAAAEGLRYDWLEDGLTLLHAFDADQDGRIAIDIVQDDELIEIRFSDNGRGIPPNLVDKIFDPFFTTRRGQGGTGLGLNIVYNLVVRTFGGAITVASTVGEGTCFTLRIPQVAPKEHL